MLPYTTNSVDATAILDTYLRTRPNTSDDKLAGYLLHHHYNLFPSIGASKQAVQTYRGRRGGWL